MTNINQNAVLKVDNIIEILESVLNEYGDDGNYDIDCITDALNACTILKEELEGK